MKTKLDQFVNSINAETTKTKWMAYVVSNFPVLEAQAKTLYIKINKDNIKNKQKKIELTFFYVDTDIKDNQLTFREDVFKFIDKLKKVFEERDCRAVDNSYSVNYETFNNDKYNLSVAEITVTYDYTTLRKKEYPQFIGILDWDCDMK